MSTCNLTFQCFGTVFTCRIIMNTSIEKKNARNRETEIEIGAKKIILITLLRFTMSTFWRFLVSFFAPVTNY